jgi:SSS family solute:Na+ symporter
LDYIIFGLYMCGILAIGFYHYRRNRDLDDYYVGGRQMGPAHVGLSIVATDVGGGFSIGLGGLGFTMGLAGSWLLFTGLVGAWLSAILIIPRLKALDNRHGLFTYPDFLRHRYGEKVAVVAALISGIGYLGFTGGQVLAGAKLASATIITRSPLGLSPLEFSLLVIGVVTIAYTVIGGLKAVIYTDTIQWLILLIGLIVVTIPLALWGELGGISGLRAALPPEYFSLSNIAPVTFVNWMVTIIPIWLIAMTLYQRAFACATTRDARRAWYLAGLLEYPIMAFMGVFLGMCAKVMFPDVESEMGLPLLIKTALPIGVTGLLIAAYFSAIMSTADSCLMASSGNFVNDIITRFFCHGLQPASLMRLSHLVTLIVGLAAIVIASRFEKVLEAILFAYSFMVAGLFVPTLGAYFWRRSSTIGALVSMLAGGTLTLLLETGVVRLPPRLAEVGLSHTLFGLAISAILFVGLSLAFPDNRRIQETGA